MSDDTGKTNCANIEKKRSSYGKGGFNFKSIRMDTRYKVTKFTGMCVTLGKHIYNYSGVG